MKRRWLSRSSRSLPAATPTERRSSSRPCRAPVDGHQAVAQRDLDLCQVAVVDASVDQLADKYRDDVAFPSSPGGVLRNRNARRDWFDAAATAIGESGLTPYELRRTAASLALSAGDAPESYGPEPPKTGPSWVGVTYPHTNRTLMIDGPALAVPGP
jgi:hypothetical protein